MRGYDYSLNPYIGCGFACAYCFAANFQADEQKKATWGKWVEVKANAVEDLLRKRDLKGKKIFMSSATDPYQPLEAKVGLTRRILETLVDPLRQPRLVVQTRGPLVTRDIDLLRRFEHVRVNMSITTDCDEVRRRFEPSCASIERRLEAISEVKAAGIATTVCIVPMLPIRDPQGFARTLRKTGADFFVAGPFRRSARAFAADTRELGLELAKEHRWDEAAFHRTLSILQRHLPELNRGDRGFHPA
jgi:DNA repair photolyase